MAVGGNVNCITKNNTDYMYEDTAGRSLIGSAQDTSTTATKAYIVGDLFWLNNLLYRVTVDIASGGTITVGTNCVATTVSEELEARVKTANIQHTYTSSDRNPISGEGVADALSGFSTTLDGLDDVDIDSTTLAQNQALVYNGSDWVNGAGGHTMIPNNTAIASLTSKATDSTDDDVASGYAIANWSNTDTITLLTQVNQGDDTVGTWEDDATWESGSRAYWLKHTALHGILSDDDVEISLVFDVADGEAISCLAYRIDDAISSSLGGIAIKFNAPVQNANGATVGVVLKRNRTNTETVPRTS